MVGRAICDMSTAYKLINDDNIHLNLLRHDGDRSVLRDYITQLKSNCNDPPTLLDRDYG